LDETTSSKAQVGDTLDLALEAHRMAGFRWELVSGASKRLSLLEEWFDPGIGRPGASGKQHFRFVALAPGEVTLRFEYRRPWAKNSVKYRRRIRVHIETTRSTKPKV
jgi:predicted secreted protein